MKLLCNEESTSKKLFLGKTPELVKIPPKNGI